MTTGQDYDIIVIGAGVVGPCVATALARQGKRVLIVEREWSKPNRIVGELMQPAGLKALKQLGMIKAISNIEAIQVNGYYISYLGDTVNISYPEKSILSKLDTEPVPGAVKRGTEDKLDNDSTLDVDSWDRDINIKGVAFHHGDFLMNLRSICLAEPYVTKLEGNVTGLVKDDSGKVVGVNVNNSSEYFGKLVINCDGIFSKFRKELGEDNVTKVGSYFIGLDLVGAKLPSPNHGHVILGDHAPVLVYQISPLHTRILCAYRSQKLPKREETLKYLTEEVLPALPKSLQASFSSALSQDGGDVYRAMANQYLTAKPNTVPGFICVGDSLNMRHPLTGGGMTVGLNDAVLLCKILSDIPIEDLANEDIILDRMLTFHSERKGLDVVLNTLSIALYALFAADNKHLKILQRGCFAYFQRGGDCTTGPIALLSGLMPDWSVLFGHFFCVAFYACYVNFVERGLFLFPLALWENLCVLITAAFVILPYLFRELFS